MQFQLNYSPKPSGTKIDHHQQLMLIGSCFAENVGLYLHRHRFNSMINPSGILFNPLSIHRTLTDAVENKKINDAVVIERNDLFFSLMHHSSIFKNNKEELLAHLQEIQTKTHEFLKLADLLIITLGTAYVYEHHQLKTVVANCHKQAASDFEKKLLTVNEIVSVYKNLIQSLKQFNPKIKILFTVSPVKYLKDGVEENNLSKGTLLLAINELKKDQDVDYFPAYELVNDDLRDYRFYKEDMAHPNHQAIQYVWEKFSDTYFTEETKQLNKEIASIVNSEKHTLLFPESEEAKKFTSLLEIKKNELKRRFPFLEL